MGGLLFRDGPLQPLNTVRRTTVRGCTPAHAVPARLMVGPGVCDEEHAVDSVECYPPYVCTVRILRFLDGVLRVQSPPLFGGFTLLGRRLAGDGQLHGSPSCISSDAFPGALDYLAGGKSLAQVCLGLRAALRSSSDKAASTEISLTSVVICVGSGMTELQALLAWRSVSSF